MEKAEGDSHGWDSVFQMAFTRRKYDKNCNKMCTQRARNEKFGLTVGFILT